MPLPTENPTRTIIQIQLTMNFSFLHFDNLNRSEYESDEEEMERDKEQMSDEHIAVWFVKSMHGFGSIRNWSSTAIWS